jgi:hypothetical protein
LRKREKSIDVRRRIHLKEGEAAPPLLIRESIKYLAVPFNKYLKLLISYT